MSDPLVETLIAARAKIADPKNWTTGEIARDKDGLGVAAKSPAAVCWCSYGALRAEGASAAAHDAWDAIEAASLALFDRNPILVNDGKGFGHPAVLRIYDKAISDARSKP